MKGYVIYAEKRIYLEIFLNRIVILINSCGISYLGVN